ncbi:MAG: MFS transporter [Micrococcales bacterium]
MEGKALNRWHAAVFVCFTFLGMGIAALVTRMPEIKSSLGVSTSQLGVLLLLGSLGSIGALIFNGRLIERFGTKPVLIVSTAIFAASLVFTAIVILNHQVVATAVMLFISFASYATADISINVDAAQIEKILKKSVLPRMHAAYSLGAFFGAGIATAAIELNLDLDQLLATIGATSVLITVSAARFQPSHIGQEAHHKDKSIAKVKSESVWKDPMVILLGIGVLGITITEGAASDWLAIGFTEGHSHTLTNAGVAMTIFNIAMALVRFFGGKFVDKYGRKVMIRIFAFTGIVGVLLVILAGNLIFGWIGAALWGVGVALGFPLFISAAGEGKNAAKKVSLVAAFGYMAFLIGPPALGLLAEKVGILNMFYVLVAALSVAIYFAKATQSKLPSN